MSLLRLFFPFGCVLTVGSRVFTFFCGVLQILGPLPPFWLGLHPFLASRQWGGGDNAIANISMGIWFWVQVQSPQLIKFILRFQHTQAFSADRCLYVLSIHVEIK